MGQSGCRAISVEQDDGLHTWAACETPFGWTGFERCDRGILRVWMGHRSRTEILKAMPAGAVVTADDPLCSRLQDYFAGAVDDFSDVPVAAEWNTPFQKSVIRALRQLGYGQTTTYAKLAHRAGRPGAARAVGQVMATNPVPILVPCHRVLGSGGALGGFSAPTGIVLKRRLLELEQNGLRGGVDVARPQLAIAQ